jgi:hypothetical protein
MFKITLPLLFWYVRQRTLSRMLHLTPLRSKHGNNSRSPDAFVGAQFYCAIAKFEESAEG